jgi:hypothetical protein
MRENQIDQTTFIVHPGSGTVIDADEVLVMNMDTTGILPSEDEIVSEAEFRGGTLYEMYVVLVGNIFDGMKVVGPFLNIEEAMDWGDRNGEMDWYTARMDLPYRWDGGERIDWDHTRKVGN